MKIESEKQKIVLMIILLSFSCVLTFYFHKIIGIETIFTHFFYIPIFLASLWWKRKGVVAAVFLAMLLIFSHYYFREFTASADDYFRAIMFVVISFIIVLLSERIAINEKAVRQSGERYRALFETAQDAIFVSDKTGRFVDVNQAACESLGYSREELLKLSPKEIDADSTGYDAFIKVCNRLTDKLTFKINQIKKDGTLLPVEITGSFFNEKGQKRALAIARDITERKQAENAVKNGESRYKHLYTMTRLMCDNLPDLIWTKDLDNRFIFANKACCEELLNARDIDEPIGKTDMYFGIREKETHPENPEYHTFGETCTGSDLVVLKTKKPLRFEESGNLKGEFVCLDVYKAPFWDEKGNLIGTVGCAKDITKGKRIEEEQKKAEKEKKKLEAQLVQAQKMESIGILAGGVAHDFNNILTAIIGNAGLALMDIGKNDPLRKEIEEIKTAGERAAALTRQLLAFSRKQIIQPEVIDLNELLSGLEKMLGRLIGEDIELLTIPESALWHVKVDPGQMEQVIMNMAINARDAISACADTAAGRHLGGKLTIETANTDLNENYFRRHGIEEKKPGHYVVLTVSDTGSGMDKETRKHIFEPFFTTKGTGKGTGLGLSTVYGIVKQNNGFVWVYSEPGQGSTFKVYLPRVVGDAEPEDKEQTPVVKLAGSETVLIVEDDDGLRNFAQKSLRQYGYKIIVAENGEDALRVSKEYEGTFDLMITDVVMPKMSGKETAERMQPLYPQMKVIYMSGYTDNAIANHGVLDPGLNFLEKPFTPESLARKLREVLDK